MKCRNHEQFGRRCKHDARWMIRINDDPDTDLPLCGVHADLAVRHCWPTQVSKTIIVDEKGTE